MAVMSNYCKAYAVEQLRHFPSWSEAVPPLVVNTDPGPEARGVSYYYLHDDYTVTAGVFRDQKITFDRVTEEWKNFCASVLDFHPPARTE